jgi:hypothetical protein
MSYTIPKKCQCEREIVYNIQPLTGLVTDISHLTLPHYQASLNQFVEQVLHAFV